MLSASTPGSGLPSIHSRKAPPAVETKVNWSATPAWLSAHLKEYAPGLREGMQVRRGQMLGRVGVTGNSNPDGPHLHYAVHRMDADDGFWEGAPVNPYPLLVGR